MTHTIRIETGGAGRLIVAAGELDSVAAPHLEQVLRAAFEANPDGTVTLDLAQTEFVDSRTMSVLVAWTERQRAGGGRLVIARSNPNVLRVFRQIGLDSELNLVSTLDEPHT